MRGSPGSIQEPTHAGGVVVRHDHGRLEFLLVTARRSAGEWVLPKGHIERGETAEGAAAREVFEEAGVTATACGTLGDLEYTTPRGRIRVRIFLMEFQSEEPGPGEGRRRSWLSADETRARLPFPDARALIDRAMSNV